MPAARADTRSHMPLSTGVTATLLALLAGATDTRYRNTGPASSADGSGDCQHTSAACTPTDTMAASSGTPGGCVALGYFGYTGALGCDGGLAHDSRQHTLARVTDERGDKKATTEQWPADG